MAKMRLDKHGSGNPNKWTLEGEHPGTGQHVSINHRAIGREINLLASDAESRILEWADTRYWLPDELTDGYYGQGNDFNGGQYGDGHGGGRDDGYGGHAGDFDPGHGDGYVNHGDGYGPYR